MSDRPPRLEDLAGDDSAYGGGEPVQRYMPSHYDSAGGVKLSPDITPEYDEYRDRLDHDDDTGYNWGPEPVDEESVPPEEEHRHGAVIPQVQQWPHRI